MNTALPLVADDAFVSEADVAATVRRWRERLKTGRDKLATAFRARPDTSVILRQHERLVYTVVRGIWAE